ncbi:MAG: hypothetical protein K2N56_13210, partial [Oscillospiraceae bacterium]|nr:hypothetical protein [Oscillospiraceae bacterium]
MIADEKNVLNPTVGKLAEKLCRSSMFPTLIVDDLLCCVYSSHPKIVPVGTLLSLFLKEPPVSPLKKERDVILFLNNVSYCARFIPIDKTYSFCQLLDFSSIMTLAACTDMYSIIEQRFSLLRDCLDNIRNFVKKLEEELPSKSRVRYMQMVDISAETDKFDRLLTGMSDYIYMSLSPNESDQIIDTHGMVDWIVKRSNSVLEQSGKCLEFITDVDAFYICANQRYAIISILNAVQNALLYSPVMDTPVVSLTK